MLQWLTNLHFYLPLQFSVFYLAFLCPFFALAFLRCPEATEHLSKCAKWCCGFTRIHSLGSDIISEGHCSKCGIDKASRIISFCFSSLRFMHSIGTCQLTNSMNGYTQRRESGHERTSQRTAWSGDTSLLLILFIRIMGKRSHTN